MRHRVVLVLLLAVTSLQQAIAGEDEFQITPRIGQGELRVDAFRGINTELEEVDTVRAAVSFGYLTPVGVVAEVGADSQGEFDLFGAFDRFSLAERYVALGYQFELGRGWRFVPKIGRTRWKLHSEEGQFLNPGPEDRTVIREYDYFWEATLARRVSRVLALGVGYKEGDYSFGRARSLSFVMAFGI